MKDEESYMKYQREININKILYQIGDTVNLPLGEKGKIESIAENIPWGFNHYVKITEGGVFNEVGDIVGFKSEQFK